MKYQNLKIKKQKTRFNKSLEKFILNFWFLVCVFDFCILIFGFKPNAFALNLDNLKVYFLNSDYKAAIAEGEKIIASSRGSSEGLDELYYILGLSYMKDGNYLRASDIFEIILKEFSQSPFKQDARLSLGDTFFLRGDFSNALKEYKELLGSNQDTGLKAQAYSRISQAAFKTGDTEEGKAYIEKLRQEMPENGEPDILDIAAQPQTSEVYYTVQVGSFSKEQNAQNFLKTLQGKGYPAFIEEAVLSSEEKSYRVKVGKYPKRQEAAEIEKKLANEGYPTKIRP